jgi:branched-chain amino acid transport system substrate-binding protein
MRLRLGLLAVCIVGAAIGGSAASSSATLTPRVLDIYSSLPLQGPSSAQTGPMVRGIQLALRQARGHAGSWIIHYISLDDSTAFAGKWDPDQCVANASRAAEDPRAIYYIGEFNSGCSEITIPILNQAGIPQVSPSNTYDGLTISTPPGTAPGEPQKFYPTGARTYLRLSANDTVQAAALLSTMHRDRCRRVAIANDREDYGAGLAALVVLEAGRFRVHILGNTGIDPTARSYRRYARRVGRQHVDCFLFAGIVANNAVPLVSTVAAAVPRARLYGGDGICTTSFSDPAEGGIAARFGRRFKCTTLTLPTSAYPGGRAFLAAYRAAYGISDPDPYAIYGYEAMQLGLDTIAALGASANSRSAILQALFAIRNRHSVIGSYGFDANGDTTLRTYGLYRVHGRQGNLVFVRNVKPR